MIHETIQERTPIQSVSRTDSERRNEYEITKGKVFESLASHIFTSIIDSGNISKLSRHPNTILEPLCAKRFKNFALEEVGFDLTEKRKWTPEEKAIAGKFLVNGIKKIYDERFTPNEPIRSKLYARQLEEKDYNWKEIQATLEQHWSLIDKEALLMKKRKEILLYIADNENNRVAQTARDLNTTSSTINNTKNTYKLDENNEIIKK